MARGQRTLWTSVPISGLHLLRNYHKISLTASGDKRPWLRRGRWSGASPLELIVIVDELLEIIAAESRDSPDRDTTSSSSSAARPWVMVTKFAGFIRQTIEHFVRTCSVKFNTTPTSALDVTQCIYVKARQLGSL